jgi:pimeloyl-ACP methyl ester carboxylesterase
MAATRRTIDNNGVEIAFDEAGEGDPIVWLHGMAEDRTSWDPITDLLAGEFRSIRVDFRGHGESTRLPHYEGGDLVSDVAAVIGATCETPPYVIGHSLGGMVATAAAALGIAGPAVSVDQPLRFTAFTDVIGPRAARLRDPNTYGGALSEVKIALGLELVPEPTCTRLARKSESSDQQIVLDLWEPMLDGDVEAIRANDAGFESLLGGITLPYLALHGTPVDPGYDDWLTTTIATAEIEHWSGLGHWLHLVEPARFASRVRAFAATS